MSIQNSLRATELVWAALGGNAALTERVTFSQQGALPSRYAVSDAAAASMAAAALALAEWTAVHGDLPAVQVDRRLVAGWFRGSLRAQGWAYRIEGDVYSGDYATADGWIRLHTFAAHHRQAARAVLGNPADRAAAERAVSGWPGQALEEAIVAAGGCAAVMRSREDWQRHPQGISVAGEPLIAREPGSAGQLLRSAIDPARPLTGIRVLDLTRVIAGPAASRFMAGYGADVLRIDPSSWSEPGLALEMNPGKRCARLDLKSTEGRATFTALLTDADILLHGYRADALDRLGLDAPTLARIRPGLVDVALDAYGWTGPWRNRRGFDSLVQMSCGIADAGMRWRQAERPVPLPVQALDHATGYLVAAAALRGLTERRQQGVGSAARLSLARTAEWLCAMPVEAEQPEFEELGDGDFNAEIEETGEGPIRRLRQAVTVGAAAMRWDRPAGALGDDPARW